MRRWFPGHLIAGEGTKNVWVCFMDKQNNWSAVPATDKDGIVLDQSKPDGEVRILGNCSASFEKTTTAAVKLSLNATDTLSQVAYMKFSNDGVKWSTYEAYKTTKTGWALAAGTGEKIVYAMFKDQAGNESDPVYDTITLASTCSDVNLEYGKGIAVGGGGDVYMVGDAGVNEFGNRFVSWIHGGTGVSESWILELTGYSFNDPLAVDGGGNIYTTGVNGGALYLVRYDPTGSEVWHTAIGTAADIVLSLTAKSDGTSHVARQTVGGVVVSEYGPAGISGPQVTCPLPFGYETVYSATMNAGNAYLTGLTSEGSPDTFVARYDASGDLEWVQYLGAMAGSGGYGIAANGSDVYVTGYVYGSLPGQASAGMSDCFVAKYPDAGGLPSWVRQAGASANDWGGAVTVDGGNVYVMGATGGAGGSYQMFALKYEAASGNPLP